MKSSNKKKYGEYVVFAIVLGLFLWPTSRAFFQQQLMKVGFFQPKFDNEDKKIAEASIMEEASFITTEGQVIKTADLKGKVVFINFWASWCGPCLAEMPSIQILYDKFKHNTDVVFLIVSIDNKKLDAEKFIAKQNFNLPFVFSHSSIPEEWLGNEIPTTIILNKSGLLVAKKQGLYDYSGQGVQNYIQHLIDQNNND